MKILAIDDNKESHTIIKALIKNTFPDSMTLTALTGSEGFELASAEDPDVILLDIIMPGIESFDLCKKLKADEILRDIPVVFLISLKGDKETRIRSLEAGGDAFLAKPIDEIELTAQLRAMVKIKNANFDKRNEKRKLASLVEEQIIEIHNNQTATLNILEDLTRENEARKKSEEALRESQEKFKGVFENSIMGISLTAPDGKLHANKAICDMLGYTETELTKLKWQDITHPDDIESTQEMVDLILSKQRSSAEWEKRYLHKNGNIVWVDISSVLTSDSAGKEPYFITTIIDITQRKHAELAIKESERRFRDMLENIELVAISLDNYGNITFCNDYCLKLTGWRTEEVMGRNWFELFIPPESEIQNIYFSSILNGQMPVHIDNEILTRDGKIRLISWNNTMLHDLSGVVIGTSSIGVDITENREAEEKIFRQLEELQRWQLVTLGREDRNLQLKHEVNKLLIRLGETIRYPSQINDPTLPI